MKIWQSTLDNKWDCYVERMDAECGMLVIAALPEQPMKVGLIQFVPLRYGALFGPDVEDVAEWQEICMNFADRMETMK